MPHRISQQKIDLLHRILVEGPIKDDMLSPVDRKVRDELVSMGCVAKIVVNGVGGFNAATYAGSGTFCRFCGEELLADALKNYEPEAACA